MESLAPWLNPLDALIVFALLGGIVMGFVQGLVRMALSILVLYVATVLAMTFYVRGGWLIAYLTSGALPRTIDEALAFLLILLLFTLVVNFVLNRTYKDTALPGLRKIDQLGGMVLGFVLVSIWVGLAIVALAFVLTATSEIGSGFWRTLSYYFTRSTLIPIFYRFLPLAYATLRPWMPKGLPPGIFGKRFS